VLKTKHVQRSVMSTLKLSKFVLEEDRGDSRSDGVRNEDVSHRVKETRTRHTTYNKAKEG
jgi:hypothetical protein